MIDLDNLEEIKKLDPKNCFGSTEMLADQVEQMWADGKNFELPENYKHVQNVIICGMGASSFGGYIVKSLLPSELKVPVEIINDYHLPVYASENSLVIVTSYSGTTEESISCYEDALKIKAKMVNLSSGGTLEELAKKNNTPALIFTPKFNPANQPRMAPGYTIIGTLIVLLKAGLISISDEEMSEVVSLMKNSQEKIKSSAKELAKKMYSTIPLIFAAEHLFGNSHILRNQLNETAKSFAAFEDIPELNHHLMEGFKNSSDKKLFAIFLFSNLYSEKHTKRMKITEDVVGKNNVEFFEYIALGNSKLSQIFTTISFGGYLSFYLGILYGQDPSLIPWVDYFKEQLKK